MRHRNTFMIVSLLLGVSVFFLSECVSKPDEAADLRGSYYAGASACRQCHQAVYDSFLNNAHFRATSAPTAKTIRGNFNAPDNVFSFDSTVSLMMEKTESGYYQVLHKNNKRVAEYRFDVLFGFKNAQTSFYWKNDQLFELPVSHYTSQNKWATSPGFPANTPVFSRFVGTDCLDCHSSAINIKTSTSVAREIMLDSSTLIHGIDCERCHGPAMGHVRFHQTNPLVKSAAFLLTSKELSQQQQIDACAICHSGNDKEMIQSRFVFKMGDTLGYFVMPLFGSKQGNNDVHGNQLGLLQQSKCFKSNQMTCGTCHDAHNSGQSIAVYSQKCMGCHKQETNNFCPQAKTLGEKIISNCIDCHMPKQSSNNISYTLQGANSPASYLLRTHKIGVFQ